jgi:hypothetical protein
MGPQQVKAGGRRLLFLPCPRPTAAYLILPALDLWQGFSRLSSVLADWP